MHAGGNKKQEAKHLSSKLTSAPNESVCVNVNV